MNSTELYELFRADMNDAAQPYLWSDLEVFGYMNDAYRMFVRLTGGIADSTSALAQVPVVAGVVAGVMDSSVMEVSNAYRVSDGQPIGIHNGPEFPRPATRVGPVRGMVIGEQDDLARWTTIPDANDTVQMSVYRMPAGFITEEGQEFTGVKADHHLHLLPWMRHLAYLKQDAETFDRAKSDENGAKFRGYCDFVKSEVERRKHKIRVVAYGGIPMP